MFDRQQAAWLYEQPLSTCLQLATLPSFESSLTFTEHLYGILLFGSELCPNVVAHILGFQLPIVLTGGLLSPAMQVQG